MGEAETVREDVMTTEDETTETAELRETSFEELPEPEQGRIHMRHAQGRATAFGFPPGAGDRFKRFYRRGAQRPGR